MIGLDTNVLARSYIDDDADAESPRQRSAALSNCNASIDFADALHHASYRSCTAVATFDDRRFAPRAMKLGMTPAITVLA